MKISDIQVDGFGVWKGLTVESLSDNVTVFFGQNEAGKTTLMQFVRAMMFGYSADRREKYLPPVYGGLGGGSVEVNSPLGTYEIQRLVDPNRDADPMGDLSVVDTNDGNVHGAKQLRSILCEIDESIFNNVFAIGLREIQELGALNSTEASELLYKLTSGLDRVSLVDVMRDLSARREKIWTAHPKIEARLNTLGSRREDLLQEVDLLKARSKRWAQIATKTKEVSHELEELTESIAEQESEARLLEIGMQINDRWASRRTLIEQINNFGRLPDLRDVSVQRLDELNSKISAHQGRIQQIKQQRTTIKKDAMSLPINRQLWAQKSRIDALSEHAPWVESLQRQSDKLRDEIKTMDNSLIGDVGGLGDQLQIRSKDVRNLGTRGLANLSEAATKLTEQRELLKRMNGKIEKSEFDLGQHQDRLSSRATNETGSLEETTRYVNRLRRRVELEGKINKLQTNRQQLEREIDGLVADQVMDVGKLSIVGIVFILGTVLVGFGLIDALSGGTYLGQATTELGFLMMLLGAVCGFVAMGLKYHWERIARDELDDFRHQMDVMRQQLKRSKIERDEIERQLPASIGQYELELADAEVKLSSMEELVPLENRVQSARSGVEDMRRQLTNQQREVETADKHWKASLRTAGLPETIEPFQLKEISQRSERIAAHNIRLEQFQRDLTDREKELSTLRHRIDTLVHDCGVTNNSRDVTTRLTSLTSALNQQRTMVNSRKELANQYKSLRTKLNKTKRELERLQGQKRKLLSGVGADTEEQYRHFELKHTQRKKLLAKRKNLTEQIAAGLGKNYDEEDLEELLNSYGSNGLEKQWETLQAEIEETKIYQTKLHQQRGEFLQELKTLGEDSRLDMVRLELNSIDAEIAQCKKQWQVLATGSQMLESIREKYESKRQPETLQEASGYLKRLTDGKYTRIWTRLVGEELLVDNAEEETITVDKLSRGTREAVYLSLRLALIGAYARRGAVLPMVMDDILVNFDTKRARLAAELLVDFSRNGYQLLMFTCHEHMRDLFYSLDVPVKTLPHHRDVVEHQAVPVDYKPTVQYEPEPVQLVDQGIYEPVHAFLPEPLAAMQIDDDLDPDLEYELSAVEYDQRRDNRLRHELVYISPNYDMPIDLSGNDDIWYEQNSVVRR